MSQDFFSPGFLFAFLLVTIMLPAQVTLIPNFLLMRDLDWMDKFQALIFPGAANVFGVFLLRQFFLTIPTELEDAARIDGCGKWGIYTNVILPLSKPVLLTVAMFTFVASWNDFLGPLLYLALAKPDEEA